MTQGTVPTTTGADMAASNSKHKEYKAYMIPYSWWEPFLAWLATLEWGVHGLKDLPGISKHTLRCTWIELLLAFQTMSGFEIDRQLDLRSQEKIIRTMFRKITSISKPQVTDRASPPSKAWTFGPSTSLKSIIGHLRQGFLRRPILSNAVLEQIVRICSDAQQYAKEQATFGVGFKVQILHTGTTKWVASANMFTGGYQTASPCHQTKDHRKVSDTGCCLRRT